MRDMCRQAYSHAEEMANICVQLGKRIRLLRADRGWSQQFLADKAEISRQHVSTVESGKREAGLLVLQRVAKVFGLSVSELLKDL